MDRNWGPVGLPGIGAQQLRLSPGRGGLPDRHRRRSSSRRWPARSPTAGTRCRQTLGCTATSSRTGSARGCRDRFRLGLWETVVLSGVDRDFDGRYRNPLSLLLLANQYGLGADGNVMFGVDAHWRVGRPDHGRGAARASTTCSTRTSPGADRYPEPLGAHRRRLRRRSAARSAGGRSTPRRPASPSARSNPFENFTDARRRPRPELRRHGPAHAHRRRAPRHALAADARAHPAPARRGRHRRSVSRDARARRARSRSSSSASSSAPGAPRSTCAAARARSTCTPNAGLHHVVNAGHEEGRTVNRFEGRLQATLGLSHRGVAAMRAPPAAAHAATACCS